MTTFNHSGIHIVDLNAHYGLISVHGNDAATFLQGQLTSDIRELSATNHGLSAYCNIKGRVRAIFRIFLFDNTYFLQLPLSVLSGTLAQLKKVARFSKVSLEDVSSQWTRFGVSLESNCDLSKLPVFLPLVEEGKLLTSGNTKVSGDLIILSLPGLNPRFEVLSPKALPDPLWMQLGKVSKIQDFEFWKLLDIKAGIPEIWPETVEQFLPHSLNLPALGAVNFNKGCYCGQEIVARMEYRGKLKRQLVQVTLEDTETLPLPGSQFENLQGADKKVGTVVTASKMADTVEMLIESND